MTGHTPNPLPDLPRPTKAYHKTVYPYVSPTRPELNVSGKTLFVTGGGSFHAHIYNPPLHFMLDIVQLNDIHSWRHREWYLQGLRASGHRPHNYHRPNALNPHRP